MRLLYVCTDPGIPVDGHKGAAVHVRELCRALASLGHDVRLAAARLDGGDSPPPVPTTRLELAPAARHRIARLAARGGDPAARAALTARGAARAVAAGAGLVGDGWRPDAVYERHALFGGGGLALARRLGVPHLLEVNAPLVDEQARHRRLAWPRAAEAAERAALRDADAVLAVSGPLARWAVDRGAAPGRVHTVPNGVDVARFAMAEALRAPTRARLGWGDDAVVVGFVGSLRPWHDASSLLRAFAAVAADDARPRLLVVGDGPERGALEAQAAALGLATRVRFAGAVAHDRVPALLAALDVAVAPYDAPGSGGAGFYFSPLKLFEYMAAGRAVVAADLEPIRGVVAHGRTGWLYRPGDVGALAGALRGVLADPARARAVGLAARQHVRARHTWRRNAALVAALAAGRAGSPGERAA